MSIQTSRKSLFILGTSLCRSNESLVTPRQQGSREEIRNGFDEIMLPSDIGYKDQGDTLSQVWNHREQNNNNISGQRQEATIVPIATAHPISNESLPQHDNNNNVYWTFFFENMKTNKNLVCAVFQ